VFSRDSAFLIGENSIALSNKVMSILKKSRMLSTRGIGETLTVDEIDLARSSLPSIAMWMDKLMEELGKFLIKAHLEKLSLKLSFLANESQQQITPTYRVIAEQYFEILNDLQSKLSSL